MRKIVDLTLFWTICSSNGIVLEKEQLDKIERYRGELAYWNKRVNLISRKEEDLLLEKHVLHSLAALKYVEIKPKSRCLDVGTGGGLPGIPIAIALPSIKMTLVDSIRKKTKIVELLADHAATKNMNVVTARAEELVSKPEVAGGFDFIFARAAAKIQSVVAWTKKTLKPRGKYVLHKGGDLSEEIAAAKKMFPTMEIEVRDIDMVGADWFKKDEKKIVICSFK